MAQRKVLGKGISTLIRPKPSTTKETGGITNEKFQDISIEHISVNPDQPRKRFQKEKLQELANSIQKTGLIQPVVVRKTSSGFELIAGERRFRAAQFLGLKTIPAVIRNSTEQDRMEIALIENIQRENLSSIEEAKAYQNIMYKYSLTQEEVAQKVGKDRATVANHLRLLKLPPQVQTMVDEGKLSMGHARALISLEQPNLQEKMGLEIIKNGFSVRETEKQVAQITQGKTSKPKKKTPAISPNLRDLKEQLQRRLGTKVEFAAKSKGGELRIQYLDPAHLTHLSEQILKG